MSQERYNNARQIVVTTRNGKQKRFPATQDLSEWSNAFESDGWLNVHMEGRTESFRLTDLHWWERIEYGHKSGTKRLLQCVCPECFGTRLALCPNEPLDGVYTAVCETCGYGWGPKAMEVAAETVARCWPREMLTVEQTARQKVL